MECEFAPTPEPALMREPSASGLSALERHLVDSITRGLNDVAEELKGVRTDTRRLVYLLVLGLLAMGGLNVAAEVGVFGLSFDRELQPLEVVEPSESPPEPAGESLVEELE